jgi:Leucine rich repeat
LKPHHHTVHHHQKQHNNIHLTQEQQHKLTEQSEKTSSEVMRLEAISENQLLMKDSKSNKKTKKKKSKKESNRSAESSFLDTEVSHDDSWQANLMELGQNMLSPVAETKIAPSHPSSQPTAFESFPIKPEFTIWDDEPFSNLGSHDMAVHKRKSSTMTDLFNSYLDSDSMSALTYGDMTPRPSHTSSGKDLDNSEVSHQLLMSYLLSMGTDRTTAEQLALTFLEEQKQISSQIGTMNKPIAVTAGSKMNNSTSMAHQKATEAMLQPKKSTNNRSNNSNNHHFQQQRPNSSSHEIHQDEEQDLIEKDDDYINLRNSSPTSFTPVRKDSLISALVAEVVPATESEAYNRTPVVYAETVKLGVKDLFQERPVRRFACILGCLLVIGMIVLALFLTVFKKHGSNSDASSMSPSAAPTFINQEILDAAYKISGEEVFYVEESPQRKAVAWMSSVDLIDTAGYGDAFVQRYSLIVFYYSLNGEQWTSQERWLNPTMYECTWSKLVNCDYDASEFQVLISMDIPRNNLQGTIPPEIGQFVSMESLSLPKNKISGVLPSSLGKLTSLNEINLSDNLLNGEIPSAISALSNLFSLDLSINGFDSTIPTSVFSLISLRTLTLSSNKFSGTLNKQVNNLQSLKSIDVRGNALTGTFPIDFDSLPELDIIYLDNNKFSGELPLITNSIIKKEVLSLSHNSFVGNAQLDPDFNVSALVDRDSIKVRYIDISYNKLTGPISATFMVLPGLRYFDLSGNTFTGTFPSYVQWDTIEFLAAGSNALSGTLPVGWPTLSKYCKS